MEVLDPDYYKPVQIKYAGFWLRFLAIILDTILIGVLDIIILVIFFGIHIINHYKILFDPAHLHLKIFTAFIPIIITSVCIKWFYFAGMESSRHQATPGKMALDIKVTGMEGNRISFARATGRYFGKILSGLILDIGYIMAGLTDKKQALHDKLADTIVITS